MFLESQPSRKVVPIKEEGSLEVKWTLLSLQPTYNAHYEIGQIVLLFMVIISIINFNDCMYVAVKLGIFNRVQAHGSKWLSFTQLIRSQLQVSFPIRDTSILAFQLKLDCECSNSALIITSTSVERRQLEKGYFVAFACI